MNLPQSGDFIDIHNHGAESKQGVFSVGNIMAHEERVPDFQPGITYCYGIHPWHLTLENYSGQIDNVKQYSDHQNVIALGEAGFDRIKGPEVKLQQTAFREQVKIADEKSKPLIIHCVRAWDELLAEHKKLKPSTPWLVHGFRGKKELALQLVSKGIFLSFWFGFILRAESSQLIKGILKEKIFLETDGSGADIKTIYNKVATDMEISVDDLKVIIFSNFMTFFKIGEQNHGEHGFAERNSLS